MHESVVPIRARKTVQASIIMNHQPALALPKAQAPTSCIMSPIGADEPPAVGGGVAAVQVVVGGEVFKEVAEAALNERARG